MIITLCGSSRFPEAFEIVNMHLSLLGHTVIGLGMYGHADKPSGSRFLTSDGDLNNDPKQELDELHKRKIDLADAIFVVNPGNYIGESTLSEIDYASTNGKEIYFLFPDGDIPSVYTEE